MEFKNIIKENKNRENVVVVTHGGVISSFLARLLGAATSMRTWKGRTGN